MKAHGSSSSQPITTPAKPKPHHAVKAETQASLHRRLSRPLRHWALWAGASVIAKHRRRRRRRTPTSGRTRLLPLAPGLHTGLTEIRFPPRCHRISLDAYTHRQPSECHAVGWRDSITVAYEQRSGSGAPRGNGCAVPDGPAALQQPVFFFRRRGPGTNGRPA